MIVRNHFIAFEGEKCYKKAEVWLAMRNEREFLHSKEAAVMILILPVTHFNKVS